MASGDLELFQNKPECSTKAPTAWHSERRQVSMRLLTNLVICDVDYIRGVQYSKMTKDPASRLAMPLGARDESSPLCCQPTVINENVLGVPIGDAGDEGLTSP